MKMEDVIQTGGNVVIGAAAVLLAPLVISGLARFSRPLAKTTLKGGLIAWERIKELSAETKEDFEDLSAEVQAEMSGAVAASGAKEKEASKSAANTSSSATKRTAAKKSAAKKKPVAKTSPSKKTQAKTASAHFVPGKTGEKKEFRPQKAGGPEKGGSIGDSKNESNQAAEKKQTEANAANEGLPEAKSDESSKSAQTNPPTSPMTGDSTPGTDNSKREGT